MREVAGAVRQGPEGLVGDAAQAQPGRRRADLRARARRARAARSSGSRTSRSGTSATSRTRRPSASSSRTRSSRSTTCSTASPGSSRGSSSSPSGCCANLEASHGLVLQPAPAARARRVRARARRGVPARPATRACGPGRRSATSASSSRADAGDRRPRRPRRGLRPRPRTRGTSTPSSSGLPRSSRRRSPSMPETAVHVGSGKVRELYALDDERLLLVASDRISTFDVVLPTEIPDKGRVLTGLSGVLVRAHARASCPNHLLALRARRPLDRVPAARDAADRVRRPRLPRRLGLEGLPRDRRASAGTRCPTGLRESERLPEPIFTPATKATDGPRREHRPRARRRSSSARSASTRSSASRSRSTASPPSTRAERGIILADTKFEFGLDADGTLVLGDEAFTPDSSRFWPADEYEPGRPAAVVRQAVRARLLRDARLGQDRPGPRASRRTSSPARARATSRRSSGSPGSRSTTTSPTRAWCSR